jgi:hypothetical protein
MWPEFGAEERQSTRSPFESRLARAETCDMAIPGPQLLIWTITSRKSFGITFRLEEQSALLFIAPFYNRGVVNATTANPTGAQDFALAWRWEM